MATPSVLPNIFYIIEGIPLFILNLLIVVSVLRHSLLRSKNTCLLLVSVAAADAATGLGQTLAGIHRASLIASGWHEAIATRLSCVVEPFSILFLPIDCTYGLIQLSISIDRVLSVLNPLRHGGFGSGYVYMLMLFSQGPIVPIFLYSIYEAHGNNTSVSGLCLPGEHLPQALYERLSIIFITLLSISCALYLLVILKVNKVNQVAESHPDEYAANEMKLQHRLTISLGMSSLGTLMLMVVPMFIQLGLASFLGRSHPIFAVYIPVKGMCTAISMALNFFILTIRHKHIRMGIKYLFQCKELTQAAIDGNEVQQVQANLQMVSKSTRTRRTTNPGAVAASTKV